MTDLERRNRLADHETSTDGHGECFIAIHMIDGSVETISGIADTVTIKPDRDDYLFLERRVRGGQQRMGRDRALQQRPHPRGQVNGRKGGGRMSCKYCDVKSPKKGQLRLCGSYPTGKPIFADHHYPRRYVFIAHLNGCRAVPDEDRWVLVFMENWTGTEIDINHCPICGRELGVMPDA